MFAPRLLVSPDLVARPVSAPDEAPTPAAVAALHAAGSCTPLFLAVAVCALTAALLLLAAGRAHRQAAGN
jgi:hypothetical protein